MLLHQTGVCSRDGQLYGYLCNDCLADMTKAKLPAGALANNMWIGDVPTELAILSLPERILISRYFAAAYVVKLYPRSRGNVSSTSPSFNSGLRGNMSTYRLNTSDISSMIQGDLLPHHPLVLPGTIGITIIGPKNVGVRSLPKFLNVSRQRVQQALTFLKNNNPLYERIRISDNNLSLLLDDAVPLQLSSVVRELKNSSVIDQEQGGYVPDEEDDEDNSSVLGERVYERYQCLYGYSTLVTTGDEEPWETDDDDDVSEHGRLSGIFNVDFLL